ncbi:hypothetical protein ACVIIW_006857 [Bradyrhizobium sp. USDA 4449]
MTKRRLWSTARQDNHRVPTAKPCGSHHPQRKRRGGPSQGAAPQAQQGHLAFVREQPCLVCQRTPCDAYHLKFAQPRALGRNVSDEFAVPLCRAHHEELHRHGNERAWWANLQIGPLLVAQDLWAASPVRDLTAVNTASLAANLGSEAAT